MGHPADKAIKAKSSARLGKLNTVAGHSRQTHPWPAGAAPREDLRVPHPCSRVGLRLLRSRLDPQAEGLRALAGLLQLGFVAAGGSLCVQLPRTERRQPGVTGRYPRTGRSRDWQEPGAGSWQLDPRRQADSVHVHGCTHQPRAASSGRLCRLSCLAVRLLACLTRLDTAARQQRFDLG